MFRLLAIAVALVVAVILILAATKPSTYHVERSISISAPPQKTANLVDDFHLWDRWSPWAKLDPEMKVTYSGPQSGIGSIYHWKGNSKVGEGEMEILSVEPGKTTIRLDFLKPFEGNNTTVFYFAGNPDGPVTVRWTMDGPANFMTRVMLVFTSMDKMIGPDFEQGLANLKTAAER
ncbi:SRPBCC family protein [Terriglobus tenax]|uniref:SRPBCC family protein n=1 Tax=Terriglobus tenax TaxID=1111115 RepID=UPI0021DF9558|nr:SRPBCC family protein [Terriglobus tenax]